MSNPFALLDFDEKVAPKVAAKKAAPAAKPAQAAAPKKDAKAAPTEAKKPMQNAGQRDRHTKGGRDAGEVAKRPYDRSLNRQKDQKTERKGEKTATKGSWGNKDPKADQVEADVEQKKDDAEIKAEELKVVEEVKVEVKQPEEPAPFLLNDALKARKKVAGDNSKIRAADTTIAETALVRAGTKPDNNVQLVKKSKSKVSATKGQFTLDEFFVVAGGQAKVEQDQYQRKQKKAQHFPAL